MIGHTTISKSLCTFLLYQTNASISLCATASTTRQGIVTMLGLGSGGSLLEMQLLQIEVSFVADLVTFTLIRDIGIT